MLVVFSFFLLLFNSVFRNRLKYFNVFTSIFIIVALIYSAGFRIDGYDFSNYKNGYEWNSFREPFFRLLVTFLHILSASYRSFFVIVATITVLLTYKYLAQEDGELYWLALLVFVSNYYMQHDYIQIRIGLACSIFLYQLYYIAKGKKKKALALWIISCCCHFSMIIGAVSFFISKKRISDFEALSFLLIFTFLFILAIKGFSLVSLAYHIPGISYYYRLYTLAMKNGQYTTINIYNPLYLLRFFIFFLCLFKRKILLKYTGDIFYYLRLYFCGILIYLLFADIPVFAFRGSEIFFITELLLFPMIKRLFADKNIGNCSVALVAVIFFGINVFHNHLLMPL